MEAPLREIVANCGEEPSVVLNKVKDGKGNYGYNAANGEYGDMIEFGILDPTKVPRSALQHAASIAGLLIPTEAMMAELPTKEETAMPGGGGMRTERGRVGKEGERTWRTRDRAYHKK